MTFGKAAIRCQKDFPYDAVDAQRVLSAMSVAEGSFNNVILDACGAGA